MLQGVLDLGKGGTFQSRTERDIVVRTSLARLEQLDIGDQALYFGRIDRFPDPDPDARRRRATAATATATQPPYRQPRAGPCSVSRSTSAGWPCPDLIMSHWWWTGGRRWPSPSTGLRDSIRRAWPAAATWPSGAGQCSGWRTSTSSILRGRRVHRCSPSPRVRSPRGILRASACFPRAWCWADPGPSCRRSARRAPGTWATSSGPSRGSRTRSSAPP